MVLGHDITTGQRTQDVRISEDISFDTMLLKKVTIQGLKEAGFLSPSPVQLRGIPVGKCGFDLLLEAKSGTGKTAVFTVVALEKIDLKKGLQTIILAPTREIASQISDVITQIGSKYKDLNVAVVMGGLPVNEDITKFKENVHIVVGSPGRLRHLIQDKHIDISSVRLFVLDEADKLMETSFLADVNYIFSVLPKQKQVIMSSATYSAEAKTFVSKYVQKAIHICPDSNSILLGITQKVVIVPHNSNIVKQTKHRYEELKKILNEKQFKQCLIFCNYQVRVSEVHRMLMKDKWPAEQLYGQQNQTDRLDALKTLQEYKCRILVSTDLAARGIDASNVDIVINFEPPFEWETYLHRIGRAGRYGSYGTAISILCEGKETIKFKETLALTKIPFDLCNLWDGERFDLSMENKGSYKKNYVSDIIPGNSATLKNDNLSEDQLWRKLTLSMDDKPETEISTFEEMCNSFKACSKPNIESFTNLLHSFNTNKSNMNKNEDDSEYKYVEAAILHVDVAKYCNHLENDCKNQQNCLPQIDTTLNKTKSYTATHITNGDSINEKVSKEKERYLTEKMEKESVKCYILESQGKLRQAKEYGSSNLLPSDHSNSKPDIHITTDHLLISNGEANTQETNHINLENECGNEIKPIEKTSLPTTFDENNKTKNYTNKIKIDHELNANVPNTINNNTQDSHNQLENKNENYDLDEATVDPVKQALIDAGLPTAFGKKKFTRKYKRVHKYNDSNCMEARNTTKHENHDNQHENISNINSQNLALNSFCETQMSDADIGLPTCSESYKSKNNIRHSNFSEMNELKNIAKPKVIQNERKPRIIQNFDGQEVKNMNLKTFTQDKFKEALFHKQSIIADGDNQSDFSETSCGNKTDKLVKDYSKYESNFSNTFNNQHQIIKKSSKIIEQDRSRQFDLWYSQLKQQTQYIQQTLYIEMLKNL